jgi:hypothetical protein
MTMALGVTQHPPCLDSLQSWFSAAHGRLGLKLWQQIAP